MYKFRYLPETRDGVDVPVTHSGHGDHHPVDASGDGGEARGLALLYEVAEAGEAEAGDEDETEHEAQLPEALSDGVHYGLEAGGVAAQLEDSSELEYSEHLIRNTHFKTLLSRVEQFLVNTCRIPSTELPSSSRSEDPADKRMPSSGGVMMGSLRRKRET